MGGGLPAPLAFAGDVVLFAYLLGAIERFVTSPVEIAIIGDPDDARSQARILAAGSILAEPTAQKPPTLMPLARRLATSAASGFSSC